MQYGLVQTVTPAVQPVTLAEAKAWLRVATELTDDDGLIEALIAAAVPEVEAYTQRQLLPATWQLKLDCFPGSVPAEGWGLTAYGSSGKIRLPKPPLIHVASIAYLNSAGTSTVLDPSDYVVDGAREWAEIYPAYTETWPVTQTQPNAVTVTYRSGYGTAAEVPRAIRTAILFLVADLYEHREAQAEGRLEENRAVKRLLSPFRVMDYASSPV